ncbi:MAG: aminoacyl-tRNA hydrolase [Candidatus Sericytochromatia bacterium]|nr:aminoacyl-tRNA hydrolase [Candidatus Sericytochromatia bacterium]
MKLVVGLGNPGAEYAETRHNAGFMVLDRLSARFSGIPRREARFKGEVADVRAGGERVLLLWPMTYMNLSGESVKALQTFHKIPLQDILLVSDDIDLPVGGLRYRRQGSAGGQKGLQSIIRHLATQDVARLRVGVGARPEGWDLADWVLSRFRGDEREALDGALVRAEDAVVRWVEGTSDVDLMAAVNRTVRPT